MTENLAERKLATERGYNSAAQDFSDRAARQSEAAGKFLDRFVNALPDRSLIADIGCGPGHDVRRMVQAGHHVVGLDRSRALLALGPASSLLVRADLSAVPVSDNAVDGV